ncbi:MAG: hypothetical protein K8T90_09460 [Planctomycetes bacterium]|nr:hypothetical protein [Planctomycetota bacterium]
MVLTARARFTFAAVATTVGIVALVAYGWRALDTISDEVRRMDAQLQRLRRIEHLEEDLHELAAGSSQADIAGMERSLARVAALPGPEGEQPLFDDLRTRIADAKRDGTSQRWSEAAEAVSKLSKGAVEMTVRLSAETSEPATTGARDIVKLGAAVVLVGGALSVLAFMGLRRERREAEHQLRRSDRLAALGMMAASVAHELNNPLATISGCATAVRDRARRRERDANAGLGSAAAIDANELEYLDMIVDETRRCGGIVRSLRDLARDSPPAMIPADLPTIVREVVALVSMSREGPAVDVSVSGEAMLEAVCDPDKIKQLLLNLLVNARDACSADGRVQIAVELEDPGRARIVVTDDGRGIAPDDLARVFEPFHTGKTRGLGLGLFICERIVTLHGGTIAVASDGPGRGARFTVTLPLPLQPNTRAGTAADWNGGAARGPSPQGDAPRTAS